MDVQAPTGVNIGSIHQKAGCCKIEFGVLNEREEEVLVIKGPCCLFGLSIEFEVS